MPDCQFHDVFDRPTECPAPEWFCPPPQWSVDPGKRTLRVSPAANSDYWQRTHYGFQADNGHFLFTRTDKPFLLTTHVRFEPAHQYDQAGLMVRLSSSCWLKTSVEYELEDPARLGAVVTNAGYSDWSTQDLSKDTREIWLRIHRQAADYIVEASQDGKAWTQIRMAHLAEDDGKGQVMAGIYACCPKEAGYLAEFSEISMKTL